MSKLVLGAAQFGFKYGIANSAGQPNLKLSEKILSAAIENGVTFVDTANAYGDSELVIGKCLDKVNKNRVCIITKLDPLENISRQESVSTYDVFVDLSVYGSMKKLDVDQLEILLLHRTSHLTQFQGAIFDRLLFHLKEGRIGALGVSVDSPEELMVAISNEYVTHIQMPLNVLDWRWADAVEELKNVRLSRELTVHVRSVFLQGLLLLRDKEAWSRANCSKSDLIFKWLDNCIERFERDSVKDICIAFVNGFDWVDGVVVGMETYEQLVENLVIFSKDPLNSGQRDELVATRPSVSHSTLNPSLWRQRSHV